MRTSMKTSKKKKKKKSPFKQFIPLFVILFILAGLFIVLSIKKPLDASVPEGTIGNTAGNIRGKGLFCEYNGKVYFSNPYDGGALYVMNPDGSEITLLLRTSISYINAGGNYLFYQLTSPAGGTGLGYIRSSKGIYRSLLNGSGSFRLDPHITTSMVLVGNWLYSQHYDDKTYSTFHKIPVAGSETEYELSKEIVDTACVQDGILYYGGLETDHFLYAWDTKTDTAKVVWEGNLCYPTVIGSRIYFMNIDENYRLFYYDMASGDSVALTDERIECYNIYNNMLFYQISSSTAPALMRMNLDTGETKMVAEGNFTNINTTSVYTYFQRFDEENAIYRTNTFGSVLVDDFPAAKEAAPPKEDGEK